LKSVVISWYRTPFFTYNFCYGSYDRYAYFKLKCLLGTQFRQCWWPRIYIVCKFFCWFCLWDTCLNVIELRVWIVKRIENSQLHQLF
jgi:hypothetical protein